MSSLKKGLLVAAVVTVGIAAFYFLYWVKTPQHSIALIREAIARHDVVTFEKHVNLDRLLDRAFDDAFTVQEKITGQKLRDNALAANFIDLLKPSVVSSLRDLIVGEVAGKAGEAGAQEEADGRPEVLALGLRQRFNAKNSSLKDVAIISRTDSEALAELTVYDKQLEKDFTLKLRLSRLADQTWQVCELDNLVDYCLAVEKAKREKLEALNRTIGERMEKELRTDSSVEVDNSGIFFVIKQVRLKADFKNESGKDIKSFKYLLALKNAEGRTLLTMGGECAEGLGNGKELKISDSRTLNPFSESEAAIGSGKYDREASRLRVTEIIYADGERLAYYTKLPDPAE